MLPDGQSRDMAWGLIRHSSIPEVPTCFTPPWKLAGVMLVAGFIVRFGETDMGIALNGKAASSALQGDTPDGTYVTVYSREWKPSGTAKTTST